MLLLYFPVLRSNLVSKDQAIPKTEHFVIKKQLYWCYRSTLDCIRHGNVALWEQYFHDRCRIDHHLELHQKTLLNVPTNISACPFDCGCYTEIPIWLIDNILQKCCQWTDVNRRPFSLTQLENKWFKHDAVGAVDAHAVRANSTIWNMRPQPQVTRTFRVGQWNEPWCHPKFQQRLVVDAICI